MRYVHSPADDPWKGASLTIDHPGHVLTLLYIQEVWGLRRGGMPRIAPAPVRGESRAPHEMGGIQGLEQAWDRAWQRAWAWYERLADGFTRESTPPAQLSFAGVPPMWEAVHGSGGIDRDALVQWQREAVELPGPVETSPEHVCGREIAYAYESGIDSILVLPFTTGFVHRLTSRHLVVSTTTRRSAGLYAEALIHAAGTQPRTMIERDDF